MLYKNCRELPYHNFNEIQVVGDLTYLIKDKEKHSQKDLENHWIDILEEYLKLTNDFSQKKFFRDKAELNYLRLKLSVLKHLEPIINLDLSKDQRIQIDFILNNYRVLNIEQDILGTIDDINIKMKTFENAYTGDNKSNFEETLAVFRMNGCNISRNDITVSEWVALLNQMKKQTASSIKK